MPGSRPARRRELLKGLVANPADWEKVTDILDVWFDSGSTHTFTLEDPEAFPGLAGIERQRDGGKDRVMYLEGSDQHRGWFQSSLLESCGTRGRAPFDVVLTHGFILDEKGEEKMSKSKGNTLSPQDLMKTTGADILRLWVASSDYSSDIRFGPAILQGTAESYRKLRNTLRWMLGMLAHYDAKETVAARDMPELERLMLHRLAELDGIIREAYAALRLQARGGGAVAVHEHRPLGVLRRHPQGRALLRALLQPEAPGGAGDHRADLPLHLRVAGAADVLHGRGGLARALSLGGRLRAPGAVPQGRRSPGATRRWPRSGRRSSACAASSPARWRSSGPPRGSASSLEAAPQVFIADADLMAALDGVDLAEVCITSGIEVIAGAPPEGAFTLDDVAGVGVVPKPAEGSQVRALLAHHQGRRQRSGRSPSCPRATRPPCASSTAGRRRHRAARRTAKLTVRRCCTTV